MKVAVIIRDSSSYANFSCSVLGHQSAQSTTADAKDGRVTKPAAEGKVGYLALPS